LRGLARAIPLDAGERALFGAEDAVVEVPIPMLEDRPTPLDKARILLEAAAEVEHMLMVQYLYAHYSLYDPADPAVGALSADQKASLGQWREWLVGTAREEMAHLLTVENLLLFTGFSPNFDREDMPPKGDLYPFPMHLEPLGRASLARYVIAEAPWDRADIDDIRQAAGVAINPVGILYGLLAVVFSRPSDIPSGDELDPWQRLVRDVAAAALEKDPDPTHWHLPDGAFHPETKPRQGDNDSWAYYPEMFVRIVETRQEALDAIRDIGLQGEGPVTGAMTSHFERFLAIYRGAEVLPLPMPGEWPVDPVRQFPTDPRLGDYTEPQAHALAEEIDHEYGLLLGDLAAYLATADSTLRSTLQGNAIGRMTSIRSLVAELVKLPPQPGAQTVAAPVFTYPRFSHVVRLLDGVASGPVGGPHQAFWRTYTREDFVSTPILGLKLVDPGHGASSNLIHALNGELPFGKDVPPPMTGEKYRRMPAGRPPMPAEQIAWIEAWIDAGAPPDA
jgi:hypothetical protein